jgi:hypothetical protein
MTNHTTIPEFKEPTNSFRYEELTEEDKLNLGYKRTYMEKLTKRQIMRITGLGFLSFCALILLGGFIARCIVELAVWGYNGFGLW